MDPAYFAKMPVISLRSMRRPRRIAMCVVQTPSAMSVVGADHLEVDVVVGVLADVAPDLAVSRQLTDRRGGERPGRAHPVIGVVDVDEHRLGRDALADVALEALQRAARADQELVELVALVRDRTGLVERLAARHQLEHPVAGEEHPAPLGDAASDHLAAVERALDDRVGAVPEGERVAGFQRAEVVLELHAALRGGLSARPDRDRRGAAGETRLEVEEIRRGGAGQQDDEEDQECRAQWAAPTGGGRC
jgi:hypothetical protein